MDLDAFIRRQADALLARQLCAFLLWVPLATVPLTLLIDWTFLGILDLSRERSEADVIMLHLPGIVNLYPLYRLVQLGRVSRTLMLPAVLGVLMYAVPQAAWLLFIANWRTFPPLGESPILVLAMIAQSNFYSLVLWWLTFSVLRGYRDG
jgi:hypothetical protein